MGPIPGRLIDAAVVSLAMRKLDDAEDLAMRALDVAGSAPRSLADAHAVLVRIALARHDGDAAREHAAAARKADPSSVLPLYVDGSLLYQEGNFDDALVRLEKANAALKKDQGAPPAGLHYLTAEALIWADRPAEAETQLLEELSEFPHNLDARAALATLYQSGDERDQAAEVDRGSRPHHTVTRGVLARSEALELARRPETGSGGTHRRAATVRHAAKRALM